ncbi:MAG: hypothetical protein ACLP6G_08830 [Terriglobales bacterium]
MPRKHLTIVIGLAMAQLASAQQPPQVKLNVLNVCAPSAEEQQEIASALQRIPLKMSFTQDFEIDRGRSLLDQGADLLKVGQNTQISSDPGTSDWVRLRREFPAQGTFATVQYSFSQDPKSLVETLVFRVRDPKDLLLVAIEDSAAAVATPASMLATDTPATRIKLERFGKSSVVLARCLGTEGGPPPDQSIYEPLFRSASAIAANYRDLLGVRRMVPEEMARIGTVTKRNPVLKPIAPERKPQ